MNDIKYVLTFTYNLLSSHYLTFGSFTFSLLSMMIGFMALSIISWFIYKLID